MKGKETILLAVFLLAGLLLGSILGEILGPWMPFLRMEKTITWKPAADLDILKYDLDVEVRLNLARIGGLALAYWIYRKIK